MQMVDIDTITVKRVHWLRARSQKNRWEEEFLLVCHEMQWTTRYFVHLSSMWEDRFRGNSSLPGAGAGAVAYAARQAALWKQMGIAAENLFARVNRDYIRLIR